MKILAIIVDDEPLAREGIRNLLAEEGDIDLAAECADGLSAVKAVEQFRPDLLFLDIQMPRLNGFQVLERIPADILPLVIFVTAYDKHAIRAFEINALDYLLKPFSDARFKAAVRRAREQLVAMPDRRMSKELVSILGKLGTAASDDPRIVVKSAEQILFIRPGEIDHIESAGNYLLLHCGKTQHVLRETMADMEVRLKSYAFMRVSRSELVNLQAITHLQPGVGPGEFFVVLRNGARLGMTCSLSDLQRRMRIV